MKNYLVEILFEMVPKVQNTIKVKEKIIGFFQTFKICLIAVLPKFI